MKVWSRFLKILPFRQILKILKQVSDRKPEKVFYNITYSQGAKRKRENMFFLLVYIFFGGYVLFFSNRGFTI